MINSTLRECNSNTPPLLSVCIPTFNRAELLDEALRYLHQEFTSIDEPSKLEIVIVDNCSTDETSNIIEKWRASFSSTSYITRRRQKNVGPDNVYLCSEFASGEFVLLLSDDDILLPGSLNEFFRIVREHPAVDAVSFNIRAFNADPFENLPTVFPRATDEIVVDGSEVLMRLAGMITYMSIIVFRRSIVLGKDYTFARNNNLIQSYVFTDVIKRGVVFILSKHTAFAYRDDNSNGWDYFGVMVTNFSHLMNFAEEAGLRKNAIRYVRKWQLRHMIIPKILHFKEHGAFGTIKPKYYDGIRRIIAEYPTLLMTWMVAVPLLLFPKPVAKGLRAIWRHYKAA